MSAIIAGLVAQALASTFGYVAPFMFAILPLAFGLYVVCFYWRDDAADLAAAQQQGQNDGHPQPEVQQMEEGSTATAAAATNSSSSSSSSSSNKGGAGDGGITGALSGAITAMYSDVRILLLGLAQSAFEGAMYIFVFLWTPAVQAGMTSADKAAIPYGVIFAGFMAMIMVGSSTFSELLRRGNPMESIPYVIHVGAFAAAAGTIMTIGSPFLVYATFMAFEMICGIFFPTYGSLRSIYIPEGTRSTVMNFFRVPLNLYVVLLLIYKKGLSTSASFSFLAGTHAFALVCWVGFMAAHKRSADKKRGAASATEAATTGEPSPA